MKKQLRVLVGLLVTVILATLILTGCSAEQNNLAPVSAQAANPLPAIAPASSSNGMPQEGVKVHGQWTIDVLNSDGTAAGHYEFENALAPVGNDALVKVLGRSYSVGAWAIGLVPQGLISYDESTSPWHYGGIWGGPVTSCPGYIGETGAYMTNSNDFQLTVTSVPALELKGSIQVPGDVTIGKVQTILYRLDPSVPPQNGWANDKTDQQIFTEKTLDTPVSLVDGQTVQVTVVISFS